MADVKCPMCAKPNRSDADVCEFCGARITPVTAPLEPIRPGETPTPKRTSDLEQTLPGWLRDVRKATNQEDDFSTEQEPDASQEAPFEMGIPSFLESAPQPQADDLPAMPLDLLAGLTAGSDDEDEETPDWLKNLRADTPDPAPDPAETAAGTDLQDLLASLDPRQEKPPTPSQQPASESWDFDEQKFDFSDDARDDSSFDALESPDWLAALKSDSDQALAQTPESSENMDVIPGQEGDLPAWLQDMAVSDNASPASPQPASPINQPESTLSPDDTPDWLAALSADATPAPAAAGAGAGDTPDWLAALSADETPIPAESPLPAAADDTSDWLASLSDATPAESAAPADDTPDWLASLSDATPAESAAGDTPDWLAALSDATPAESAAPAAADDTPDWLASLSDAAPAESAAPAAADDTPDWLAALSDATPAPAESAAPAAADDTPDWLAALSAAAPAESAAAEAVGADNTPDWLAALPDEKPEPEAPKPPKAFKTGSLGEVQPAETPDWLTSAIPSGEGPAFETDEHPAGQESSIFAEEGNIDSILAMDVPDWLAGFTPGELETPAQEEKSGEQAFLGEQADLAPARLPSWVQALRPVESIVADAGLGEEDRSVEQEGPLAGFRAVLPAQASLLVGHKPPVHSLKLQADQTQQSQAALLDALVRSELKPRAIAPRAKRVSDRFLRWIVAIVLLSAVFVPSLFGTHFLPIPTEPTNDLKNFIFTIYELDSQSPVLIVMDYQPALAGEMETALTPVLNDLMVLGKPLSFISSLPTGPMMTARMIDIMRAEPFKHTYRSGDQFVDLGYLPGDAAGIRAFVSNPRQTVGLRGKGLNDWDSPLLSDIRQLSDFSAILVVTDNPDIGRIWVEQAASVLEGQPMLMVISAQAEPMLIPYYDSGQVRGLLTGIGGGAVYETSRQQPGKAGQVWDAYGFGLLAIQLLIFVGGTWSLVTGMIARRKEPAEKKE